MRSRRSRRRGRALYYVAAVLTVIGCASEDSFFRTAPPTDPSGGTATAADPAREPLSAAAIRSEPAPSLGMVIVGGRWLRTPLATERTATTLLVNGIDAAPLTPEELSREEPWPAGEPDSFDAVFRHSVRRYEDDCIRDGVAGLAAARAALLTILRGSEFVGSVTESDEYIVARSAGDEVLSLELILDKMQLESLRRARDVSAPERTAAAAERRRKGLDEIEARLRWAEASGSLVLISGLDGNATYPPAVGRGKFLGIHRVMREPGLDREARIRRLLPIVHSALLAEQIADRFEPEPIAEPR